MTSSRRATVWADTLFSLTVMNGAQQVSSLHLGVLTTNMDLTVVRTLIHLNISSDNPGFASGLQRVSLGIGVVSEEAFLAGVVPDPNVNTDFPSRGWVWRDQQVVLDELLATGVVPLRDIKEDIASQRKLDKGELVLIVNNDALHGSPFDIIVTGIVRILFKR